MGYERESRLLWAFNHCEVMGFGHRLRSAFIKKWYAIGQSGLVDDDVLVQKAITLEKTISGILGHDLLPPYPVYLLLLLQQVESTNPIDTTAASYGRLYGAVMTAYLAKGGELETKVNYLTELAYLLYSTKTDHLSNDDARHWHATYCARHLDPIDYGRLREELVRAQVLSYRNDQVSFRYKAGFYYFVALYFAENLGKEPIREEVKRLCSHLYREAAANIVVFLCHLSKDSLVVDQVLATAGRLFPDVPETDIMKDAAFTSKLDAPASPPMLCEGDPEKNRLEALEHRDTVSPVAAENDDPYTYRLPDGESAEGEPTGVVLDINFAIKTIQIAGQILRNYGGRLEGPDKLRLADACFSLSLRMMKYIYLGFEANEQELIRSARQSLGEAYAELDPNVANELANSLVFGLLKLATVSLIKQVSTAVGVEKLSPVFAELRRQKPTLARRMIDLSIRFDQFGTFPVDETFQIFREARESLIVADVIRQLVFSRFYYFVAPHDIKQRVCNELGIKIQPMLLDRDPKRNV